MNKTKMMQMVREAKADYKVHGLSFQHRLDATKFVVVTGKAPKNRKEALARKLKAREDYYDLHRKVESLHLDERKGTDFCAEVLPCQVFAKARYESDMSEVTDGVGEGAGVVFPVMHACGSQTPRCKDNYFHWGCVQWDAKAKEWFAEAWGVGLWTADLRRAIAFVYVNALAESSEVLGDPGV